MEDLEKKGVHGLNSQEDQLEKLIQEGTVVIRSHGVGKECIRQDQSSRVWIYVDATCPFVLKDPSDRRERKPGRIADRDHW